ETESEGPASLENLRPLGQVRNSFIVAADGGGLWIIDQHVAHERVLFERVLRQRARGAVETQALLLPLVIELTPAQQAVSGEIAASIACHAAIKVNMPLEQNKMEWLLRELAKTECPMTCPHGRPVLLRYSLREIERAFKRV